jgi:hypothetical protein
MTNKNDTQVIRGLMQLPNAPTTMPEHIFRVKTNESDGREL